MTSIIYNGYKPVLNLKTKRLKNILYWAIEVKHLGMIPAMKFLMDENCQSDFTRYGNNIINIHHFFANMGLREQGQKDEFILSMATRQGYTVVTRDKKFVIYAYDKGIPIIYSPNDEIFFLVEKPDKTVSKYIDTK